MLLSMFIIKWLLHGDNVTRNRHFCKVLKYLPKQYLQYFVINIHVYLISWCCVSGGGMVLCVSSHGSGGMDQVWGDPQVCSSDGRSVPVRDTCYHRRGGMLTVLQ